MAKNTLLFSAHIYRSDGIIRRVRVLEGGQRADKHMHSGGLCSRAFAGDSSQRTCSSYAHTLFVTVRLRLLFIKSTYFTVLKNVIFSIRALHLSGSGPRAYHFLHRALLAVLLPVLPTAETQ